MLNVYLRFAMRFVGVIVLLLGILNALCYSFGVEVGVGIMCGMLLFDVYIGELMGKLKGGK